MPQTPLRAAHVRTLQRPHARIAVPAADALLVVLTLLLQDPTGDRRERTGRTLGKRAKQILGCPPP